METKHTKGEWKVETQPLLKPKGCTKYYITSNDGELLIAEFTRVDHLKAKAEANAKLIASAPDLLEALIDLVYELTGEQEAEDELEKGLGKNLFNKVLKSKYAIKKATT